MARHRVGSDLRWGVEPFRLLGAFGRDLAGLALLAAGSLGIGLIGNGLRAQPLALRYQPPEARLAETVARTPADRPPASHGDWQTISLDEFQAMVAARTGVSLDARPRAFYAAGHVPGALSLPRDDFERTFPSVRAALETNPGQPIVVYCAEADCRDSELVADALSRLGFQRLRVYKEGWEEWQRAGLPQETSGYPQ